MSEKIYKTHRITVRTNLLNGEKKAQIFKKTTFRVCLLRYLSRLEVGIVNFTMRVEDYIAFSKEADFNQTLH